MKMKTKIAPLLALMFIVSVFFLPIIALADASPPEEEETPRPQSPWADYPDMGNPFTPDGVATVIDNATSDDGKEFFTFTTPEGNVFFLIVDRSRPRDNVYFLNAVTERDLLALVERSGDIPFDPVPEPLPPTELEEAPPKIPEPPTPQEIQSGGNGTIIFITIAAVAFGGATYYLKIVRPKKQGAAFDDEDDEYEDEDDFDDDELEYEEDDDEEQLFDEIQ